MQIYLSIFFGSAIGGVLRFWLTGIAALIWGESFPIGTLLVNVIGCLIIGIFGTVTGPDSPFLVSPAWRQFVMIGILGGFTTFSSFSYQTLALLNERQWLLGAINVILSVLLCLFAAWIGQTIALAWIRR